MSNALSCSGNCVIWAALIVIGKVKNTKYECIFNSPAWLCHLQKPDSCRYIFIWTFYTTKTVKQKTIPHKDISQEMKSMSAWSNFSPLEKNAPWPNSPLPIRVRLTAWANVNASIGQCMKLKKIQQVVWILLHMTPSMPPRTCLPMYQATNSNHSWACNLVPRPQSQW